MSEEDDGTTRVDNDDGDSGLSSFKLSLWEVCLDVRQRFDADVIFSHSEANWPQHSDAFIEFFVPRHHPKFADIVAALIERVEPLRRGVHEFDQKRKERPSDWAPTTYASIRAYSGVVGARAFLIASDEVLRGADPTSSAEMRRALDRAGQAGKAAAAAVVKGEKVVSGSSIETRH